MRLFNFIQIGVWASVIEDASDYYNDFEENHDDIRYSKCQAELLRKDNIDIPDSLIDGDESENDEYCSYNRVMIGKRHARGALAVNTIFWKDHFNQSKNKYEVPYMFEESQNNKKKESIRKKLDEFKRDTCVELVEIPYDEKLVGPFGKYDNVLVVSNSSTFSSSYKLSLLIIFSLKVQTSDRGCLSYVGRVWKHKQTIAIGGARCALHEMMHALGWKHEQDR